MPGALSRSDLYRSPRTERMEQNLLMEHVAAYSLACSMPTVGRSAKQVSLSKQAGYHTGWPDIFVAEPLGAYKGLFIELKRFADPAAVTASQRRTILALRQRGYYARVCRGYHQARLVFDLYMNECPPADQDEALEPLLPPELV